MREQNVKIVEKYLNALRDKNLSAALLADDIRFENPMTGKGRGVEDLLAFLSGFLPAINDVRILRHVCDGEYVVTHWEVDAVFGIIPILELFRINDGKISETISFFDPRPILGS